MSNWWDNILPAIESAGQNAGKAIMNQAKSTYNSPVGEALTGRFSQILPTIQSDLSNSNKQIAGGNPGPVMGLMGVDAPVGENPEGTILDAKGNPISSQAKPEPENGGQYVNENTQTPQGGTPAKVKARPTQEVKFKYTPPQVETETPTAAQAPQANTAAGELPPITSEPSAQLSTPTRPTQPNLTASQKLAQKLNGLSNYQLPKSYGENRPNLEAQDKSVMQNVIGGNTADQVLQKANAAKSKIWNQVESAAGQHQAISTNNQVLPYIKAPLDDLVNQGIITQAHANNALIGETKNLTQGGADINGNATITGNQLVDLRTGANAQNKGVPYGSTNPVPYVRQAIAKGYSDAMGNLDPTINNLYQQYGSVKRIGEMSDSFRNQKLGGTIPLTAHGLPIISPLIGGVRRGAASALSSKATLPVIGGLSAAALAGGAGTMGYLGAKAQDGQTNAAGNNTTNPPQQNHNSTMITPKAPVVNNVPQSQNQITFDPNGYVGVFNPFNGTDGITKAQYQDGLTKYNTQISNLQTEMANNPRNFDIQKTDQAKIDALNTQKETLTALNAKSRSLDTPYQSALNLASMSNQATDDIKNGWSNITLANGNLNTLATLQDGKYSKLASALEKLQSDSGVTIFQPGMSLDVALGNLQQAVATQMYNSYYSNFPSQGGYSPSPSAPAPAGVPTNQLPPITPQGQSGFSQAFTPPAYINQNLSLNP